MFCCLCLRSLKTFHITHNMDTADLHARSLIFLRSIMFVSCDSFVDVSTPVPFQPPITSFVSLLFPQMTKELLNPESRSRHRSWQLWCFEIIEGNRYYFRFVTIGVTRTVLSPFCFTLKRPTALRIIANGKVWSFNSIFSFNRWTCGIVQPTKLYQSKVISGCINCNPSCFIFFYNHNGKSTQFYSF